MIKSCIYIQIYIISRDKDTEDIPMWAEEFWVPRWAWQEYLPILKNVLFWYKGIVSSDEVHFIRRKS